MDPSLGLVQSITIHASRSKIWQALTDPELIKQYLFGIETITDWEIGSDIIFQGDWQGQSYTDKGHILEFLPERSLIYDYWSGFSGMADIPENYSTVTYTLGDEIEGVLLSVGQQGFANEESRKHSESGWQEVLEKIKGLVETL